jgi:hypothetical protein
MKPPDERRRKLLMLGSLAALGAAARRVRAQPRPLREAHGALDVYAGEGVVLAWAILRGRDEQATTVVVRVEADPARYRALAVAGVDPFTKDAVAVRPLAPMSGSAEIRAPRARFADHPRTEWRFYREAAPVPDAAPALLVFYQGVPDTSPEFDEAAKLDAYLAGRLQRARDGAQGGTK